MKRITLLLFLVSSILWSQEPVTINLGDFKELKVFNGLHVKLVESNIAKIVIAGSQANDVSVKNANGILKIRLKFPDSFIPEDVSIELHHTNNIAVLDANEGAKITSEKTLKAQFLEVKTQEGAKIILPLDVKHLNVKSVSGGIIELQGQVQNQTVEANTGGVYQAYNLKSKQAIVKATSGSRVEIAVSDVLNGQVRFGGSILYKGSPEMIHSKKIIGGSIKKVD